MAVRKAEWQNKYIAKTYDRINLTVLKGQKEIIQEAAKARGMSVNGFINSLIEKELGDSFQISTKEKNSEIE